MPKRASPRRKGRLPLSRERVLRTAIDVADRDGIEAVTMRRLGHELGVEAMALYRHVADKDALVEGMVDLLIGEIQVPGDAADWKAAIRGRAMSAREVLRRHQWAPRLIASRPILSPAMLRYLDAVTRTLRDGGLSHQMGHHAMHVIGARLLGFTQELFDDGDLRPETVRLFLSQVRAGDYPAIAEALPHAHHDDDLEFEFGLDLILDGLDARQRATR